MIVSLNWLKKFVDIDISVDDLARQIGAKLVEVESVENLAPKYQGVVVARVKSAEKIDGSDHLSLCKIDDGGLNQEVARDENGLIQVVCGAPNVRANTNIAWIMPGAIVPSGFGSDDEFKLDTRKLMGYESNGMIASARELDLYDEHDGILILDEDLPAGADFAKSYELDDYLFDIENKSLTNRPDCFGVIGFAREVATILGKPFKSPQWLLNQPQFSPSGVKVFVADEGVASAYCLAEIGDLETIKDLSLLEKTYLARVGVRPISPIVDVTNYLMMLSAQPLHAFDQTKVEAICERQGLSQTEVGVRLAKSGEKLTILDGRTLTLDATDIVIVAGDEPIALAGAMGGQSTEIDGSTKRILLESASFDLYKLRTTQMRHGIFSEAITRFTKGQPAALTTPVLAQAVSALTGNSSAKVASVMPVSLGNRPITVDFKFINSLLGLDLSQSAMVKSLADAEFAVEAAGDDLLVTPPFWRTDVNLPVDVAEEVGRVYGYDQIAVSLPQRDATSVELSAYDQFVNQIRNLLTQAGANEVLTYSFINQDLAKKVGQDPANSYKITNSISPDLQICRQSLQPSLLNLVHANIKAGFDEFALYEINRVQQKSDGLTEEKVPVEHHNLALVVAKKQSSETPYYLAKKYLTFLLEKLDLAAEFPDLAEKTALSVPFESKRAAKIVVDGQTIGVVGEYTTSAKKNLKLPEFVAGFELDLQKLFSLIKTTLAGKSLSLAKFPSTTRAVCFESQPDLVFAELEQAIADAVTEQDLQIKFYPIDIFESEDASVKRTTFEFVLTNPAKTMTSDEANQAIENIITYVAQRTLVKVV